MLNSDSVEEQIQSSLMKLSGISNVIRVEIKDNLIEQITVQNSLLGQLEINRLEDEDYLKLFNFYFQGLSEKARNFFCPYPLFNPPPNNPEELLEKIKAWRKEKDWTVLKLLKDLQIIGICLLKKYKQKQPTSGLAVHEKFQRMGLGILLQTIINEQVRLVGLKKLTITLAQNNNASLKVHEKAGYKKTGRLVPHLIYIKGVKKIDRYDIEMIKNFSYK